MDVLFTCPTCKQQLEADSTLAGNEISCPSCNGKIVIPVADPVNLKTSGAMAATAMAKEEKHFKVPVSEAPTQSLIQKATPTLSTSAKAAGPMIRVKTIRRAECLEVGKDLFDSVVTAFLQKIGEQSIISITTVNYSVVGMDARTATSDYGVLVVYRG